MPNLVEKFRVKVGFLWGAKKSPPPAQLELKNTPRDISGGGSEARMTKLTAANQKPLIR